MINASSETPRERINLILKTAFELLWFEPEGLYLSEIIGYLKKTIPFTEYETGSYPFLPYIPRYEAVLRIGTIPFVKAGWLEKTKNGRWFFTASGRQASYKYKGSEEFFAESIRLFQQWKLKENQRIAIFNEDPFNSAKDLSTSQIRQYLEILSIKDIRIIIASLLKSLKCHILWRAPNNEDNSPIDMICSLDPLGFKPPRIPVHIAKCSEISNSEIIEKFSKYIEPNDVGMFFSFAGFSDGAHQFVVELKQPQIRLFDLNQFLDLWVENIEKIDQEGFAKLPIRPIHFLGIPGHPILPQEPSSEGKISSGLRNTQFSSWMNY